MQRCLPLATWAVLWCAAFAPAEAAVEASFQFPVAKAPHTLALDPSLSDPAWQLGRIPDSSSWENLTTRAPASEPTVTYMLYDDRQLYIAFVARQDAEPIVATQSANDVGFGTDDFVGAGIDTSSAGTQAYLFEVTPRGVRYEQASENVRFRPTWRSAAAIDGDTWRAVMIIPLDVMHLRRGTDQTWRVDFFRNIAARGEHLTWTYVATMQDEPSGSWPSFVYLRYWAAATHVALAKSAALAPKPRLELYGLLSAGADRNDYQQANGTFAPQNTRSVGADASIPITPTISFVATLNPDFSNVEIDQQTIAPQEFPRQLAEYRPFFTQGAQYLNPNPNGYSNFNAPPDELFYSPSVGPFDRGAKFEGTYGLQSFGLLSFRGFDQATGDTFDDQAFGYRHSLQDGSFKYWTDGVLAHHSIAGTDSAYEAGAATDNLHSNLEFMLDSALEEGSFVPNGVAHSTHGFVYLGKPDYQAVFQYVDISPTYNPLDGFTSIADIRGPTGYVNFNGSTPGMKSWSLFFLGDRLLDASGAVHQADFQALGTAIFKDGISINGLGPSTSQLREYNGNSFSGYPDYAGGSTVPFNLMSIPIGYRDGTPTPFDVDAAWGSFGGNWQHLYTAQTSRPIGHKLTLGAEYDASYQRAIPTGFLDSQFLRRLSLGYNLSPFSGLTFSLRGVNGLGGFSTQPGVNVAAGFHSRMKQGDLYVNLGSPASAVTLDRLIVKYVLRIGGDSGT